MHSYSAYRFRSGANRRTTNTQYAPDNTSPVRIRRPRNMPLSPPASKLFIRLLRLGYLLPTSRAGTMPARAYLYSSPVSELGTAKGPCPPAFVVSSVDWLSKCCHHSLPCQLKIDFRDKQKSLSTGRTIKLQKTRKLPPRRNGTCYLRIQMP